MAIQGIFTSDAGIQGGQNHEFPDAILQTMPTGSAPLLALSSGMKSKDSKTYLVTWFEENHISGRLSITNNAGTGVTLIFADVSLVLARTVIINEVSGELMFVENVAGSNVTVIRGFGGTTPVAIDGSVTPVSVQRLFTAHEEGSARPTALRNLGAPLFNYHQIVRNSWDVSGTARATQYHTGSEVAKSKRDAMVFHSEDIERMYWFSRKSYGTSDGKPLRTSDGIDARISTNVVTQGANTTYQEINDFLQAVFANNIKGQPNERIAFCGSTVLNVLDKIARLNSVMNVMPKETTMGMEITEWRSPFGTVKLLTHPLFNENPVWTKNLYLLHPASITTHWLRRTHEDANDKDGSRAGVDADFGVFTSETCITLEAEITAGKFTGIDTAAADA